MMSKRNRWYNSTLGQLFMCNHFNISRTRISPLKILYSFSSCPTSSYEMSGRDMTSGRSKTNGRLFIYPGQKGVGGNRWRTGPSLNPGSGGIFSNEYQNNSRVSRLMRGKSLHISELWSRMARWKFGKSEHRLE